MKNTTKFHVILLSALLVVLGGPSVFAQQAGATNRPATINQRKRNQQARIAQGIRSGSMTPGEAARTERKERGLNREIRGMRQENGGKLTKGDRALINHQQNKLSRQIYRQKHNGRRGY